MSRRRQRHTPEQVVRKLRDGEAMLNAGKSLGEVLQTLAISEPTWHRWRQQYGGMKAEAAKRLKELELEAVEVLEKDVDDWKKQRLGRPTVAEKKAEPAPKVPAGGPGGQ